jgi:uncharacterized repeat protein (TIGR01451 family)
MLMDGGSMKLMQRRAVPLVVLIAIIAAVLATFMFRSQFVLGHEDPAECDFSTVGLSVSTFDENGAVITTVSHGMQVFYRVALSIPEMPSGVTACNYGGGRLAVTPPNGTTVNVAGVNGSPQIPQIRRGFVYEAPAASYTVDQANAEDLRLTVRVDYTGGISHSVSGDTEHPMAAASLESEIRMMHPAVRIEISPATQVVYEGGTADFRIAITNTGGFELSNIRVLDSLETACERNVGSLSVGDSTSFDCEMSPAQAATNAATVIADVIGGVPQELSSVRDTANASIAVEAIAISIDMAPRLQRVRVGSPSNFEVTVLNPNTTGLVDVSVTVREAPSCNRTIGNMAEGASVVYSCVSTYSSGTTLITATVQGRVVDVGTLTDSVQVEVVVFELDLAINVSPNEQIIREGSVASFTVTVSNYGNTELDDVVVTAKGSSDCSRSLGSLQSQSERTYECSSIRLSSDITIAMSVTGTAPDGDPVHDRDTTAVRVIHPNSIVSLSEVDTMVLRLVVQVLTVTESNTGDSPLTDVYVDVEPSNVRLTVDSKEFIGDDTLGDGVMGPGENWVWRLVTVSLAGDSVILDGDAQSVGVKATGHGTDPLGGDITFPAYATEMDTLVVPIS